MMLQYASLRRWAARLVALMGMAALLAGCQPGPQQPQCWTSPSPDTAGGNTADEADADPPSHQQDDPRGTTELSRIVIGLDGSGSLLGHLQADGNVWIRTLQALQLLTATQPVKTMVTRVGGPVPETVTSLQISANPCFFTGCAPFAPVSSNLPALWRQAQPGQLTILVSDLETDASLTGALVRAVTRSEPEAVGVLAVQAPFNGQVFDPFTGKTAGVMNGNRPLYLLVTGPREPVETILHNGAGAFGQVHLQPVYSSLLPVETGSEGPIHAQQLQLLDDNGEPDPQQGIVGGRIPVGSLGIVPIDNVLTVQVEPGQARTLALSVQGVLEETRGVSYPPGQLILEQYYSEEDRWQTAQGVTVQDLRLQNSNLSATVSLAAGLPASLVRAKLPAHRGVEDWWLALNAHGHAAHDPTEGRTRGLYGLLTSLQASRQNPNAPPAAAFCFAHSPT
ncbi:MAG: hypothetical protein OXF67_00975 [Cyanobacteria bacterium MAG CAR4_bin_6]|nr:hypothetical protein [Cyanobacteria bacterium MAG CAR4_bin_6]